MFKLPPRGWRNGSGPAHGPDPAWSHGAGLVLKCDLVYWHDPTQLIWPLCDPMHQLSPACRIHQWPDLMHWIQLWSDPTYWDNPAQGPHNPAHRAPQEFRNVVAGRRGTMAVLTAADLLVINALTAPLPPNVLTHGEPHRSGYMALQSTFGPLA